MDKLVFKKLSVASLGAVMTITGGVYGANCFYNPAVAHAATMKDSTKKIQLKANVANDGEVIIASYDSLNDVILLESKDGGTLNKDRFLDFEELCFKNDVIRHLDKITFLDSGMKAHKDLKFVVKGNIKLPEDSSYLFYGVPYKVDLGDFNKTSVKNDANIVERKAPMMFRTAVLAKMPDATLNTLTFHKGDTVLTADYGKFINPTDKIKHLEVIEPVNTKKVGNNKTAEIEVTYLHDGVKRYRVNYNVEEMPTIKAGAGVQGAQTSVGMDAYDPTAGYVMPEKTQVETAGKLADESDNPFDKANEINIKKDVEPKKDGEVEAEKPSKDEATSEDDKSEVKPKKDNAGNKETGKTDKANSDKEVDKNDAEGKDKDKDPLAKLEGKEGEESEDGKKPVKEGEDAENAAKATEDKKNGETTVTGKQTGGSTPVDTGDNSKVSLYVAMMSIAASFAMILSKVLKKNR